MVRALEVPSLLLPLSSSLSLHMFPIAVETSVVIDIVIVHVIVIVIVNDIVIVVVIAIAIVIVIASAIL